MTMTPAIQEAVIRSDYKALAALLIDANEKQRRSMCDDLLDMTKWDRTGREWIEVAENFYTREVSVWGCCTARDLLRNSGLRGYLTHPVPPELAMVLAARPDKTVEAAVKAILKDDWNGQNWYVYRDLILTGRLEHPDSPEYYEKMVKGLAAHGGMIYREDPAVVTRRRLDFLAESPDVLSDLMQAFTHEEAANWATSWAGFEDLFTLGLERGLFSRDELLDLGLAGQLRNFRPLTSGFFRKLFETLSPTETELAERHPQLVKIVASGQPPDQGYAARALLKLVKTNQDVDGHAIAAAVATPLSGSQKGAAVAALKMLAAVDLDTDTRCLAAADGLAHSNADVQSQALAVLETAAPLSVVVREAVLMWADLVAPANKARLTELVGVDITDFGSAPELEPELLSDLRDRVAVCAQKQFPGTNLSSLFASLEAGELPGGLVASPGVLADSFEPLVAISTTEELGQVLSRVMVGKGDAIDLERAIEGLAQFSSTQLTAAEHSSLAKLCTLSDHQHTLWSHYEIEDQVKAMTRHWLNRHTPPPPPYLRPRRQGLLKRKPAPGITHEFVTGPPQTNNPRWFNYDNHALFSGVHGFLEARIWEAASIGVHQPRPTLCFPTDVGGWIDAAAFDKRVDRLAQAGVSPGRFEAVQSLIRLREPERLNLSRTEFVKVFGDVTADEGLSRALDYGVHKIASHAFVSSPQWNKSFIEAELDQSTAALPPRRDDPAGEIALFLNPGNNQGRYGGKIPMMVGSLGFAWSYLCLPRHTDHVALFDAWLLSVDIDANRSTDDHHKILMALAHPDVSLGWPAQLLLAVALCDKNTVTSAAAVDLFLETAVDGRLDPDLIGGYLAEASNRGLIKPSRFASALSEVANVSPLVAERIRQLLCAWLSGITEQHKDTGQILETLELACLEAGRSVDGKARAQVEAASSGSSKRAKAAKRVLALDGTGSDQVWAGAAEGLLARVDG